jgi:hypothetical protein
VSDPDTLPEALPEPEPEPLPEALPEALHPANVNAPTSSETASNVVFMVFTPFSFIVQPDGQRSNTGFDPMKVKTRVASWNHREKNLSGLAGGRFKVSTYIESRTARVRMNL